MEKNENNKLPRIDTHSNNSSTRGLQTGNNNTHTSITWGAASPHPTNSRLGAEKRAFQNPPFWSVQT